jgi:hypothetical protein
MMGWTKRGLVLVLTASGAFAVARLAAATLEKDPPPPVQVQYTEADYAAATQAVDRPLSPGAREVLRAGSPAGGPVMLFLVRDKDRRACEDLARQLRELRRRAPADMRLVVWTPADARDAMETFLRTERIRVAALQAVDVDSVFGAGTRVVTPATLVVSEDGRARGVAHSKRFPGSRPRSFATELGFAPAR